MGYNRILAAIDASSLRSIVYEQAIETAQLHQAELLLFHTIEADISTSSGTPLDAGYLSPSVVNLQMAQQAWEVQLAEAKQWLQEFCQSAEQQGVKATFEAELGNPGYQVCDRARDWQADLIVVGRHGRTGLTELLLGSVSNHVVHHAPCSVLVIQGEAVESAASS